MTITDAARACAERIIAPGSVSEMNVEKYRDRAAELIQSAIDQAAAAHVEELAKVRAERDEARQEREEEYKRSSLIRSELEARGPVFRSMMADRDSLRAELEREKARLDHLAEMLANMPDLRITYTEDPDTEDDIGMIPVGWNLRCNSVCTDPLTINAPTLRAAIDSAIAATQPDKL